MEPMPSSSGKQVAPFAALGVIMFTATLVGGWLYVDNMRGELEARIRVLEEGRARVGSSEADPRPPLAEDNHMMAPTAENGWRTVVSSDGTYQLDLPPGTKLSEGEGEIDYVIADPADPGNDLPFMSIREFPHSEKSRYLEATGGRFFIRGDKGYWLSTWEGIPWEPFDLIASRFWIR